MVILVWVGDLSFLQCLNIFDWEGHLACKNWCHLSQGFSSGTGRGKMIR